jgi:flagellar motor switch protein FliN
MSRRPLLWERRDMPALISVEEVTRAFADELARVRGRRLGDTAIVQDAPPVAGGGWLATTPVSGAASGRLMVWFDSVSATALARGIIGGDAEPANDAVVSTLGKFLVEVNTAVESTNAAAGLILAEPTIAAGERPDGGATYQIVCSGGLTFHVAVGAEFRTTAAQPARGDARLEAVLDVDLPLIVRFGRAVVPLRTLADLGPGSVVDMGRSPDDPVELLVGERLIARGEVVIVGGNYGVRITELTGAGQAGLELEARTQ